MSETKAKNTKQKKQSSTKKKNKRKLTPFMRLLCYGIIIASIALLVQVFKEVYTTIQLRNELAEVQEKLQEVQDENAYLTSEKEKLEDPDYVASYARGNYLLSKDDEQIFYLPENSDK